jgi:Zn-dependent protease
MIGRNRELFKLFGFRITVDPLLPIVVILMAWVLADRYFPRYIIGLQTWQYVAMGSTSATLLFVSIFFHELGHAWSAKWFKLPTERIHMFLFGGMAELKYRPVRPAHESWIAIAGPVTSIALAGVFYLFAAAFAEISRPTYHVFQYSALMNTLLAVFNVVPIFPLDGGRALRGLLWQRNGRFYEASKLTFQISSNLIAILFILSFVSWFWFDPMWTLWIAAFALYMMYTALNGRRELINVPSSDDLILRLPDDVPTAVIIREIVRADPSYLRDCIVPFVIGGQVSGIIFGNTMQYGEQLDDAAMESLTHDPVVGTYIDVEYAETYGNTVEYKAEFVPVLRRGRLLGLCDPHELRFWLRETTRLRLETDSSETAYYG